MSASAEVVICGAGIAGIASAYELAVHRGLKDILLVDERPPLSLTSDKSSECYRNWWPDPAMVALTNRSIDLMEALAHATGNRFGLNRRGYLYATAQAGKIPALQQSAERIAGQGSGPLRIHRGDPGDPPYQPAAAEGFDGQPDGADLILDPGLIRRHYPYLSTEVAAVLHARRAGWFSAQQLGMYLLEQARAHGVRLAQARLAGVEVQNGQVAGVRLGDGSHIAAGNFVNAAGPLLKPVAALLGIDLPVASELHLKTALRDPLGVLPRQAPLLIWLDAQRLPWDDEERSAWEEDPGRRGLLGELPPGAHTRPEGGSASPMILLLWDYHARPEEPAWPLKLDPLAPEIALRGLTAMLPGLCAYLGKMPRPVLDGGYYTHTPENRALIGSLPVGGAYILGALSGYGLMAACAAAELLADHLTGATLPAYAAAFSPERYADPAYRQQLETWGETGQL